MKIKDYVFGPFAVFEIIGYIGAIAVTIALIIGGN